ncbi:right-handed parallel beta-helix repeat-containing protein [Lentilactobacillus kisonensis]|uniref:Right handed beta helix domain-containing protein n=2 Tax=Lentilactobacillus kisonensis TaxID=481722 RepID=A0A0R1NVV4_9LACO|nr:right-handed parallel beta-helix repeat-containing protein [Lentilactobacillus kisonensis]KRL20995.1 hypothetical protein FC98_GL000936 [Lentilactobacillus kisonensis DSM 19906 = JCM 15041]
MTIFHVAKNGADQNNGQEQSPLLTINRAVQLATPGDSVIVHEGTYREWVNPLRGGEPGKMITYQSAKDAHVIIKGSEVVDQIEELGHGIWKMMIDNQQFGHFNPFAFPLSGDWLEQPNGRHAGTVYINGQALFEAADYNELATGIPTTKVREYITQKVVERPNAQWNKYKWYAEVNDHQTVIYLNCHELNVNKQMVEISVRKFCFYPKKPGLNYIKIAGFEMAQAATNWAPPTAEQEGLIGVNWSKGWVIENNDIHDAKCCGISLGSVPLAKAKQNRFASRHDRPGYQYQIETMFEAYNKHWDKTHIGSHIIRNNRIHDCGQAGIIGFLGGIFSTISDNHLYNIGTRYEFGGWEIAALKLHAPIDVKIEHNLIDHCTLGTWLDWQAQGTRLCRNTYVDNLRDLLLEVNHGPFLVDDNVLLSEEAINEFSQGGAYVNNLIGGKVVIQSVLNRTTPYHQPHSTKLKGYACIYGGDDRYFNNLFVGQVGMANVNQQIGTSIYDGSPTSMKSFIAAIEQRLPGDIELFETIRQPAYINHNCYLGGAQAFSEEAENIQLEKWDAQVKVTVDQSKAVLQINIPKDVINFSVPVQNTKSLGRVRLADAIFDDRDGTELCMTEGIDEDVHSAKRVVGPFAQLKQGINRIVLF